MSKCCNPLISVVMPVYNGAKHLVDSIESILNQTYENFELIIVNDGSIDESLQIIERYKNQDGRIVLISRENRGLVFSLNEAIRRSQGKYVARMDADDISLPSRLEEQLKFISEKNVDICGTSVQLFDNGKNFGVWRYPEGDCDIKFTLMFSSSFAHPSVMIKREVFDKVEYSNYKHAEDYKLWVDMALLECKMSNLNKVLLKYRYHPEQASKINNSEQRARSIDISLYYLKELGKETEDIFNLIQVIDSEANSEVLNKLFTKIEVYKVKHNISDDIFLSVLRIILRMSQPMSPSLVWIYYKYAKGIKRDVNSEIFILIQGMFFLNRKSKFYQLLKRFVQC
jgi:glycosyltransferase involved in cell wall biosynthesis